MMNQVLIPGSLSDGDGLATNEVLECTSRFMKMNWCERAEPFNQIKGHTIFWTYHTWDIPQVWTYHTYLSFFAISRPLDIPYQMDIPFFNSESTK